MGIIIGRAKIEDVHDIQDVFYRTWLSTYPNEIAGVTAEDIEEKFKSRHSEEAIQRRIAQIEDDSEDKLFLVARDGKRVVGLCKASKTKESNHLDAIYVLPEYQGMGIGKKIWKECLDFFDRNNKLTVHVADYNKQAIDFYKKLGFEDIGKGFYDEKYTMPVSKTAIREIELVLTF
jgi:ribosomal protein S18 acetylase RimI-like enzyme